MDGRHAGPGFTLTNTLIYYDFNIFSRNSNASRYGNLCTSVYGYQRTE
jgi:hypothetical protein